MAVKFNYDQQKRLAGMSFLAKHLAKIYSNYYQLIDDEEFRAKFIVSCLDQHEGWSSKNIEITRERVNAALEILRNRHLINVLDDIIAYNNPQEKISENAKREARALKMSLQSPRLDGDNYFQEMVYDTINLDNTFVGVNAIPSFNVNLLTEYSRNPIISMTALNIQNFECLADPTHKTFTHKRSNRNYVEAHHLIPINIDNMKYYYNEMNVNIDSVPNIVSLCPNCHRKLHNAVWPEREILVEKLYKVKQKDLHLNGITISIDELKNYYRKYV